jgi:hypothetical protein
MRPAMYMPTMARDHLSKSSLMPSGTPSKRAMMMTGRR